MALSSALSNGSRRSAACTKPVGGAPLDGFDRLDQLGTRNGQSVFRIRLHEERRRGLGRPIIRGQAQMRRAHEPQDSGPRQTECAAIDAVDPRRHPFNGSALPPPLPRNGIEADWHLDRAEIAWPRRVPVLSVKGSNRTHDAVAAQDAYEERCAIVAADRRLLCRGCLDCVGKEQENDRGDHRTLTSAPAPHGPC